MIIETKEFSKDDEIVVNEVTINYSQMDETAQTECNNLKISIESQGAGFYYAFSTERWTFNNIDEIIEVLNDFKTKAQI